MARGRLSGAGGTEGYFHSTGCFLTDNGAGSTTNTIADIAGSGWMVSLVNRSSSNASNGTITIDGVKVNDFAFGTGLCSILLFRFESSLLVTASTTTMNVIYALD